ncbi:MAG TPA: ABC transporter permease, partial [Thermoanaerobaculaceae bacterium]|nr:ABC transporter permease [Thermoanaerobaculaceae bacterium]
RRMAESRGLLGRRHELWVTAPSFLWLVALFAVPAVIVFAIALHPTDPWGGIGRGWTLGTLRSLGNPAYPSILWRTLWLSALTTVLCLVLATPVAYVLARTPPRWRHALLLAVIVPFWTSFLVRIFAWKVLLHPEGPLKHLLVALRLVPPDASLLYNAGSVLLVLVYTELPFAILPIYAAAEKFDFRLLEAARDLGASALRAFWSVFLPGIRRGLITAMLVTLIPALGSYVVPDLVGGPTSEMLGNKIAQRTFVDRNLPHASALSALLALAVLLPSIFAIALERGRRVTGKEVQS